jgi:phenylpyruvate tautomerase PptA (4-oxalocrotonate tautomerase family)
MVYLGEVIGSLLSDVTRGQCFANVETLYTANRYLEHEQLKHFPIPYVSMMDIEVELKFAIVKGNLIDPNKKEELVGKITNILIGLQKSNIFQELINNNPEINKEWTNLVLSKLGPDRLEKIIRENIKTDVNCLSPIISSLCELAIVDIVDAKLLQDENKKAKKDLLSSLSDSVKEVLTSPKSQANAKNNRRLELYQEITDSLKEEIRKVISEVSGITLKEGLPVLVTAEELSKVPEESINKVAIKSSLSRKVWVNMGNDNNENRKMLTSE